MVEKISNSRIEQDLTDSSSHKLKNRLGKQSILLLLSALTFYGRRASKSSHVLL